MKLGIACSSGSFKGVFVHGVLSSFEKEGLEVYMYGGASSSVGPAAYAAVGRLDLLEGPCYWDRMYSRYQENGSDISKTILELIDEITPPLKHHLFEDSSARFGISVNEVITEEAAEVTQGAGARRLGKQLVLATRKHDNSWAKKHLKLRFFETGSENPQYKLTPHNMKEVLYATTRMLHAWKVPAWIDGKPYVDASYTCMCPALELVRRGCEQIIAITPEHGNLYRDFFQTEPMPASYHGVPIHVVQPDSDLAELDVNYMSITSEGLSRVFQLGEEAGSGFLTRRVV